MKARDIRGVNLGGWLVLERWITPSLFVDIQGPDEYSLSTELGPRKASERLERHRNMFITERHLRQIKKFGLNAVRVPVGYWLFDNVDGFVGGGYRYIDKLFDWVTKYDIQVLLCLHGAPGSQNGWEHSGRAGDIGWGEEPGNIKRTLEVIERICIRYGQQQQLFGVELLNEPHSSLPLRELVVYYRKAAKIVRRYCRPGVRCVVSDSFRPKQMGRRILLGWFRRPVLDQHMYQLFTPEDRQLNLAGHIVRAKQWYNELKWRARLLPLIVGEWSAAMDEQYKPGVNDTLQQFTTNDYAAYAFEQRQSFERANCGWFYWTARVEDRGPWSLLDHPELLEKVLLK